MMVAATPLSPDEEALRLPNMQPTLCSIVKLLTVDRYYTISENFSMMVFAQYATYTWTQHCRTSDLSASTDKSITNPRLFNMGVKGPFTNICTIVDELFDKTWRM